MKLNKSLLGPALLSLAAVAIAAGVGYYYQHSRPLPEGLIAASGRIEGDRILAAAKYPGRLLKVMAHEGDTVAAGALIATLEDDSVQARTEQARQAQSAAQAQAQAAGQNLAIAEQELPLAIASAQAALAQAEASYAKASAVALQAQRDMQRHRELFERGVIEQHRLEQAELSHQVAVSDQRVAQQNIARAKEGLAQAQLGKQKIQAKRQEVAAIQAQAERAGAAVNEAGSALRDMQIYAPAAGVILARLREPGEVVMPGGAVAEITNPDQLYLKVYVPEARIGKVKLGLPARIYVDSQPDQFYEAKVSYIASRAEFTPKEVQTSDERVKLMYAVKLSLNANPGHKLSPGVPADAVIRWQDSVAWQKPRWN